MYPYAVDPKNIPARLSLPQLEYFILFAILVAGKSATQTYKKLNAFLSRIAESASEASDVHFAMATPFAVIRYLLHEHEHELLAELEAERFGQYGRIAEAMRQAVELDLTKISVERLMAIPGIGPKTARFIMLYADPSFRGVPLDTHILKYLKVRGYGGVPKATPPEGARYRMLEEFFQKEARERGMTVRELDTEVWKSYSSGEARRVV